MENQEIDHAASPGSFLLQETRMGIMPFDKRLITLSNQFLRIFVVARLGSLNCLNIAAPGRTYGRNG